MSKADKEKDEADGMRKKMQETIVSSKPNIKSATQARGFRDAAW